MNAIRLGCCRSLHNEGSPVPSPNTRTLKACAVDCRITPRDHGLASVRDILWILVSPASPPCRNIGVALLSVYQVAVPRKYIFFAHRIAVVIDYMKVILRSPRETPTNALLRLDQPAVL